jgi:hypothetical protein
MPLPYCFVTTVYWYPDLDNCSRVGHGLEYLRLICRKEQAGKLGN